MRRSIARETLWYIFLTLSLVLLTISATHFVLSGHARSHFNEKLETDFDTYEYALDNHVEFYRSLLKGLAQRQIDYDHVKSTWKEARDEASSTPHPGVSSPVQYHKSLADSARALVKSLIPQPGPVQHPPLSPACHG
jgi:hypothetical protein